MANLTLRQTKGSALTIPELDGNFEYFTGSYTNTGTITAQGFIGSFTGSITTAATASYLDPLEQEVQLTGSISLTGSLFISDGFVSNQPTNSINLTIPTGYNALLVGPIYNSSSIIVETGSRLVIL
jgi:hypothetical protein